MAALFRRPRDDGDADWVPQDDACDYSLSERQRQIHKVAATRKQMERLWNEIQERWRDPWRQP